MNNRNRRWGESLCVRAMSLVLVAAVAMMAACSEEPVQPAGEAGLDLNLDVGKSDLPGKDAPADKGKEAGKKPDLAGDASGKDMADKGLADKGGDVISDGISTDGSGPSGYKLEGEITAASGVCSGGGYTLVSQVGHIVDTQTVTGGGYTLRLQAAILR